MRHPQTGHDVLFLMPAGMICGDSEHDFGTWLHSRGSTQACTCGVLAPGENDPFGCAEDGAATGDLADKRKRRSA